MAGAKSQVRQYYWYYRHALPCSSWGLMGASTHHQTTVVAGDDIHDGPHHTKHRCRAGPYRAARPPHAPRAAPPALAAAGRRPRASGTAQTHAMSPPGMRARVGWPPGRAALVSRHPAGPRMHDTIHCACGPCAAAGLAQDRASAQLHCKCRACPKALRCPSVLSPSPTRMTPLIDNHTPMHDMPQHTHHLTCRCASLVAYMAPSLLTWPVMRGSLAHFTATGTPAQLQAEAKSTPRACHTRNLQGMGMQWWKMRGAST